MYLEAVKEFHTTFGHPIAKIPGGVDQHERDRRTRLMREELRETINAMVEGNLIHIADGLADLLYVVFGTAIAYGIPIDEVFKIVHKCNMAKLGPDGKPMKNEWGKTIKPEGWVGPEKQIKELLETHQSK